jgi:hypothetical protein
MKQQTATFEEPTRRVVRPKFGTPVPMPACDGACCATVPPPRPSGVTRRGETMRGIGLSAPANANARRLERVQRQRQRVIDLSTQLLVEIADWQAARDRAYRAALYGRRSDQLDQAEHDAHARCEVLETECAAAESVLAILERSK